MGNLAPSKSNKVRVHRGAYLEAWLLRAKCSKPFLIIKYGNSPEFTCANFDQAEQYARQILNLPLYATALLAVQQLLDGQRDDHDRVIALLDEACSLIQQ